MADLNLGTKKTISPTSPMKTASPTSPKKTSWLSKLRHASRNQEGTVLHAVPPRVAARHMSALDIAMAVSPNEEILQAIGKQNSVNTDSAASPFDNCILGSGSPSQGAFDSRIGVWRDGVALWDVETRTKQNSETILQVPLTKSLPTKADRASRPRLSVRIPGSKLRQILGEEAPVPPQPFKRARISPTTNTSRSSSTLQTTSLDQSSIHPAFRTPSSEVETQRSEVRSVSGRENSRSSVSSNTVFQDDIFDIVSCYSRHSSMTSVEAESPKGVLQSSHWNYLDVPKRSASAAFSITDPVKAGIFDDATAGGNAPCATSRSQYLQVAIHPSHRAPSPTLSEAVYDLQKQLSTITEGLPATPTDDAATRKTPDYHPATESITRAPTLPKKSRKRQWLQPAKPAQTQSMPTETGAPVRCQSVPHRKQQGSCDTSDDVRRVSSVRYSLADVGSMWLSWSASSSKSSPALAFEQEAVFSRIMAHAASFEDLKSLSTVNKSTRRFLEDNKLRLFKSVLFNASPPAWELRELSPFPFGNFMPTDFLESTEISPSAYMSCIAHDRATVQELKAVIASRCQSFIRPETISSLMTEGSSRFEDAIYRIWSFCKMFGCDRGRENDLKGQTDWLKGGILAHQKGCAATLTFSPEFEIDGILLNAPDHFAAGNGHGLSAEQLYDMSEMWECLHAMLQPYEEATSKAQSCGIFRHTGEDFTDPIVQGRVIGEWIAYILSLGPSVVLELARFDDTSAGLDFAQLNDWTDWTPPQSGMTRRRFFREPVSQLYEEQLLASTAGTQIKDVNKTLLRKRQTAEMNLAYRQMSLSNRKSGGQPCALSRHDSALAPEVHKRPISNRSSTPTSPRSPSSDLADGRRVQPGSWSPRRVSPIIEDRVDTFNRLSMLSFEGLAEDTSVLAINKIMDIGFSNAQAKEALRITDMGSGLRVDRAVDWLLRQNRF
ncbi:unnamed protein product [Aureobasidium mustum]|uniref:UBA domain-containing protein n=1 Tax=Aureobasidium mustum TaxID=2773714 RepID=A0A9N8JXM9_9PEZI|nr:unnamed protein product [Aureobasidium mustum]